MAAVVIHINAFFFPAMGAIARVSPRTVTRLFALNESTPMRNEVRAVYGGFGIAITVAPLSALHASLLRPGIILTVAIALFGMALGRIDS